MICELSNLVYLINCPKCGGLQYIGETKRPLRQRMYEYFISVQNKKLQGDPNDTVGRRDQELFYLTPSRH